MLLVEGSNDKHVARQLWRRNHGQFPAFEISDREGVENVIEAIRVEALVSGRQALGIVVDADTDPDAQWRSVSDRLQTLRITAPSSPHPDGTIIDDVDGMPRIGVWLMPDNQSPGELEDFVAQMIPGGDPVWPLSQDYIDGIPVRDRKFTHRKTLRAKIYAWLASREDPCQMGLAIRALDLDIDGDLCTRFSNWLNRLFV